MKKVRIVHFWIGVIVSVFLLIESVTGIVLYFNKGHEKPKFSMQTPGQLNGSFNSTNQNGQANGSTNSNNQTSQDNQNNQILFPNGGPNFGEREQSSFSVKSLHTGIIGLISGIGLFILTGTGLALSWILWNTKRKAKKKKQKVSMAV
ncbi:hypothetical protein [Gottfriedia solisilvae]|uniref:hypothetical protein n=1 Tax=Gottfriedia solisilvae TaxID=1516104 RepID=UPI003D2F0F15